MKLSIPCVLAKEGATCETKMDLNPDCGTVLDLLHGGMQYKQYRFFRTRKRIPIL